MKEFIITKVSNGYIIEYNGEQHVYKKISEVVKFVKESLSDDE